VLTVTVFVDLVSPVEKVIGTSYAEALVYAAEPRVPPDPMFSVDESAPAKVRVFDTVRVLEVVPPATLNPVAFATKVKPFTVDGVMLPKDNVISGVVVAFETEPDTPLAVFIETEVTVPAPAADHIKEDPSVERYFPVFLFLLLPGLYHQISLIW
jgi:hypothetical protein